MSFVAWLILFGFWMLDVLATTCRGCYLFAGQVVNRCCALCFCPGRRVPESILYNAGSIQGRTVCSWEWTTEKIGLLCTYALYGIRQKCQIEPLVKTEGWRGPYLLFYYYWRKWKRKWNINMDWCSGYDFKLSIVYRVIIFWILYRHQLEWIKNSSWKNHRLYSM